MITAAVFEPESDRLEEADIAAFLIKPCEIGEVIECVASVLGLTLDREPVNPEQEGGATDADLSSSRLSLPEDLHARLLTATEFGKISELKGLAAELEAREDVDRSILTLFCRHLAAYELEEITNLLHRVSAKPH